MNVRFCLMAVIASHLAWAEEAVAPASMLAQVFGTDSCTTKEEWCGSSKLSWGMPVSEAAKELGPIVKGRWAETVEGVFMRLPLITPEQFRWETSSSLGCGFDPKAVIRPAGLSAKEVQKAKEDTQVFFVSERPEKPLKRDSTTGVDGPLIGVVSSAFRKGHFDVEVMLSTVAKQFEDKVRPQSTYTIHTGDLLARVLTWETDSELAFVVLLDASAPTGNTTVLQITRGAYQKEGLKRLQRTLISDCRAAAMKREMEKLSAASPDEVGAYLDALIHKKKVEDPFDAADALDAVRLARLLGFPFGKDRWSTLLTEVERAHRGTATAKFEEKLAEKDADAVLETRRQAEKLRLGVNRALVPTMDSQSLVDSRGAMVLWPGIFLGTRDNMTSYLVSGGTVWATKAMRYRVGDYVVVRGTLGRVETLDGDEVRTIAFVDGSDVDAFNSWLLIEKPETKAVPPSKPDWQNPLGKTKTGKRK